MKTKKANKNATENKKKHFVCIFFALFIFLVLSLHHSYTVLTTDQMKSRIYSLLHEFRNIQNLCQVEGDEKEKQRKRVNQTADDVRPWRRMNSIHLGARIHSMTQSEHLKPQISFSLLLLLFMHVVTRTIL